jgi:hypothetical protein
MVSSDEYYDWVCLSYTPANQDGLGAIIIEAGMSGGTPYCNLYHVEQSAYGDWYEWVYIGAVDIGTSSRVLEFRVLRYMLPDYIYGRYINVSTSGWDGSVPAGSDEDNETHIRIAPLATVSGTVSYAGYTGEPIYVWAFIDPEDPEDSLVASTMITAPGPYTLTGLGLGCDCYVRAFTPLLEATPFDPENSYLEVTSQVTVNSANKTGVNLTIPVPQLLTTGVPFSTELANDGSVHWYAFDAVAGGTYWIEIWTSHPWSVTLTSFSRDGHSDMDEVWPEYSGVTAFAAEKSGRYYIMVERFNTTVPNASYDLMVTTSLTCPSADIAGPQWPDVHDCRVDFFDLAAMASEWLVVCGQPYWCSETDLSRSGRVDMKDFAILASQWWQAGL